MLLRRLGPDCAVVVAAKEIVSGRTRRAVVGFRRFSAGAAVVAE
jgi:hypothetical protein